MLKVLFKVIKVLQSNDSPHQLALGFSFGAILGLIPGFTLFHFVILLVVYLFNMNVGIAILAAAIFKIFAIFLSTPAHQIGLMLLTDIPALQPFWTWAYNMPILPWTKFYNTVTLGSFILGVILYIPNYFVCFKLVAAYRKFVRDKFVKKMDKFKVVKVIKGSKLVKMYGKYCKVKESIK